ncbi:MAG: ketopantoate reductase family protein [Hyphomonadaceae bacterium]|nr:ketopantoate reductase family protein [Hyphomonadaceae bacterium]
MRILSLGAGAIGGYFGGRLVEGGADVTFLVRGARKQQLQSQGLRIESRFGNFSGPVQVTTREEIKAPFDVILLTCKAYDLPSALDSIDPAVGSESAVLPLLNGIAHMDVLNQRFGAKRILGGLAKIAATTDANGTIKHLNDWRYITFGEQDGSISARVLALKGAFDKTSVIAAAVPDIMQKMWEKMVHLATVAGMTCVMRASVGEVARTKEGSALLIEFLERNVEIAKREGHGPSQQFLDEYRDLFRNRESPYTASMLRDLEKGAPVEADHIIGFVLDKARRHGIDDSMHRFIFTHLQAYEQRRAAGRL